jgi:hypothetical protein
MGNRSVNFQLSTFNFQLKMTDRSKINYPIRVELTGVTGVGKTTIVPALKAELARRGLLAEEVDDALLKFYGLDGVKNRKLRSLLINTIAFLPGLSYISTPTGRQLWELVRRNVRIDRPGLGMEVYMLRNCWMKIGVNVLLDRLANRPNAKADSDRFPWHFILVDEGTLHLAHTIFVRADSPPDAVEIQQFSQLVPQPAIAIWVKSDLEKSIQCTLDRGHKRVPPGLDAAKAFVEFAYETFRILLTSEARSCQLLEVDYSGISAEQAAAKMADFLQGFHFKND